MTPFPAVISLRALERGSPPARVALLRSLRVHGLALVRPHDQALRSCEAAVRAWTACGQFRFPPLRADDDGAAHRAVRPAYRDAFNALARTAAVVAHHAADQLRLESAAAGPAAAARLPLALPPPPSSWRPFAPDADVPFTAVGDDGVDPCYRSSFFNIFNFDRGFLNSHLDRGLITVVYGRGDDDAAAADGGGDHATTERHLSAQRSPPPPPPSVRLWCRDHLRPEEEEAANADTADERWLCVDEATAEGGAAAAAEDDSRSRDGAAAAGISPLVAVFVGEQLEAMSGGALRAVEHCVRIDPRAPRLDTTLPAHPGARPTGNRKSIALVLCGEEGEDGALVGGGRGQYGGQGR